MSQKPDNAILPPIDTRTASDQISALTRDTLDWIGSNWLQLLIAVAVGTAIVLALHAARAFGKRLRDRPGRSGEFGTILGRALSQTNSFFMVMAASKLVVGYAEAPPMLATTVTFLFTVAAVFQAAVWARELILGFVEHRTEASRRHGESLASAMGIIRLLVSFALFAVAAIVVLDNLGVNVTGLVAGLGVGGIAIGLAAQGIFADLFAALSIIFDRPFRKGDSITYDETSGSIEEIGLKSTRIRAFTGEERIIANRNLLDKEILNNTIRNHRRGKFAIGVTYQTEPDVAARIPGILKEIVEAHDRTFIRAGFVGFGASSLDFEVEFDSEGADYAAFYDGRTAIGIDILRRFNAEGIDIAYPTQTNFTAAPDGRLVMPYPPAQAVGIEREG